MKQTPEQYVNCFQSHFGAFIQKFTTHESYERGDTSIYPELALKYDTAEKAVAAIKNDPYYSGFKTMPLSEVLSINAAIKAAQA